MKTIVLGKTGLEVSRVGIGGIPLNRPSEEKAIKVVQRALDLGVNFIDTANGYSESENRIGKAISGRREEVIIATKTGRRDKDAALQELEVSLERLRTDYIDIWQFHGINTAAILEKVLEPGGAMEGAQVALRKGKVRHIGFSSHNLEIAMKAVSSGQFETVQFPLNFVSDEAAPSLVPLARQEDMGFIAMKPFAGGRIRDADLAIKYLLQFDTVVPDPGVQKVEEIEEIVGIVDSESWEVSSQDLERIESIREKVGKRFCRQCTYCMPCPQEVFICGVLYLPILWELWPSDWFFNWDYVNHSVKSAKNCIRCGECEEKCPYLLPIREMIEESVNFFEQKAREYNRKEIKN
ncbi:MAG: aldo/keto reductase [Theionarchaea archaeon]|nr:aldo/keto reductase [Theionarchaea archaeon]MBU7036862.1 aldo/keto reductase [Theionarchaea archaeon]